VTPPSPEGANVRGGEAVGRVGQRRGAGFRLVKARSHLRDRPPFGGSRARTHARARGGRSGGDDQGRAEGPIEGGPLSAPLGHRGGAADAAAGARLRARRTWWWWAGRACGRSWPNPWRAAACFTGCPGRAADLRRHCATSPSPSPSPSAARADLGPRPISVHGVWCPRAAPGRLSRLRRYFPLLVTICVPPAPAGGPARAMSPRGLTRAQAPAGEALAPVVRHPGSRSQTSGAEPGRRGAVRRVRFDPPHPDVAR
jgi:hypothetical protein